MPNPIDYVWLYSSSTTYYADGQTVQQWIDAAIARAASELAITPPGTGGPIVTSWTSGGQPKSVSTDWQSGESTQDWIDRHFARVRTAMAADPPDTV
jgi:hypothetical protein